jgi:predicted transcriptional regulator
MGNTLTVRLPEDLAHWLDETARQSGLPRSAVVRNELERARKQAQKPWMHLVGALKDGPPDLSMRKGFSRK